MSAERQKSTAWTWRHAIISSDLPATTRHVLLTISCFMNDVGGGCYPTTQQLAGATGLSERAVCEHIKRASEHGWLKISRHGFAGQKWKNHEYLATWPKALTDDQHATAKVLTVVPKGTDRRSKKALTDGQSNSPVHHSNQHKSARARANADEEERKIDPEERARVGKRMAELSKTLAAAQLPAMPGSVVRARR